MENSGEDLSPTANHSSSSDGGNASEESGWTSYIDYFMETQQRRRKEEVSSAAGRPSAGDVGRCSSSSEFSSSDCSGVGASTCLPAIVERPSVVVATRLSLREGWRRKKVLYDESLEDTATSPISSPKLIESMTDSDATNQQKKVNSCDVISHSQISTGSDVNGVKTTADTAIKEDGAYDNNVLRKKGLCLAPMSAFHV